MSLIYSVFFWGIYSNAAEYDLQIGETIFRFVFYLLLIMFTAYVISFTVLKAYMVKNEYEIVQKVMEK